MVLLDELEKLSFLRHFAPVYQRQIASLARLAEYPAEAEIFTEGQMGQHIYLIVEGYVALHIHVPDQDGIQVHAVGPGQLLGWSPVLGLGPMTATARTLTPCRLAALDAARILALAESNPKFGREFYRCTAAALAERLRATRLQIPNVHYHELLAAKEGSD
jgi:CRP-like cAMP-binding protein